MRVVFLDIDGVLAPYSRIDEYESCCHDIVEGGVLKFDPECVANLNLICDETNADIVISSAWRYFLKSLAQMQAMLEAQGITGDVIGMTSTDSHAMDRGEEVLAYVESFDDDLDGWVVLDDSQYDWLGCHEHLVATDADTGLTEADALRAIDVLGL